MVAKKTANKSGINLRSTYTSCAKGAFQLTDNEAALIVHYSPGCLLQCRFFFFYFRETVVTIEIDGKEASKWTARVHAPMALLGAMTPKVYISIFALRSKANHPYSFDDT